MLAICGALVCGWFCLEGVPGSFGSIVDMCGLVAKSSCIIPHTVV